MPAILSRRHSNSVAEEGGRNTGRTWAQDGQRRQAEPLARLFRLYACPPGRALWFLPALDIWVPDARKGAIDREKDAGRVCLPVQEWMGHVEEPAQRNTAFPTPSNRAGEGQSHLDKGGLHLGTDGKAIAIWTTMLFPQAARPWEEGGKRRIALALLIGISPSSFVGLATLYGGSEP